MNNDNSGQIIFGVNTTGNNTDVNNNSSVASINQEVPVSIPVSKNNASNDGIISVNASQVIPSVMDNNVTTANNQADISNSTGNDPLGFDIPSISGNDVNGSDNVANNIDNSVSLVNTNEDVKSNNVPQSIEILNPDDTQNNNDKNNEIINSDNVTSTGTYLGHIFLFSIPVIGFIMLIIKAFDKKNKNISNWAKAMLLYMVISFVAGIIIFILLFAVAGISISQLINNNTYYSGDSYSNNGYINE